MGLYSRFLYDSFEAWCWNIGCFEFLFSVAFEQIQVFDPYAILGLEPGALDSEIKKNYRRLSIQYHPDKNPDPGWRCLSCLVICVLCLSWEERWGFCAYWQFTSYLLFRGTQVFCGVYNKGISSFDRSNIPWELWKIWSSRWSTGDAQPLLENGCNFLLRYF